MVNNNYKHPKKTYQFHYYCYKNRVSHTRPTIYRCAPRRSFLIASLQDLMQFQSVVRLLVPIPRCVRKHHCALMRTRSAVASVCLPDRAKSRHPSSFSANFRPLRGRFTSARLKPASSPQREGNQRKIRSIQQTQCFVCQCDALVFEHGRRIAWRCRFYP